MFETNEVINGLYGFVYDENGQQLQTTQEFEAGVEFSKDEVPIAGKFLKAHKVTGGTASGSLSTKKIDSRLQKKIGENPTAKYNYIGKLKDPTARGEEAVLFKGVSFNGVDILKFSLNELTDVELDFTFDDYEYLEHIE